ncbi:unnamed protein product [Knipowitschia caucasica]|uniref:Methyltransferase-like protein 23 n=1 Tax=Knipowitschia caucasica TaxID=637954 RepID=A0AAV2KKZ3_KNICA
MAAEGARGLSQTQKVFTFKDEEESVTVTIPEVLDPEFGMYVWPCAVVLAQFVWKRRGALRNRTVLEIGAGVSLPGVLAARLGSRVFLSDSAQLHSLQNCVQSCRANGLEVREVRSEVTAGTKATVGSEVGILPLSWGHMTPALLSLPPVDVILGSDVFYSPQDFESVLVTVAMLFRKNPLAQFWTTYQVRSSDWSIELLLSRWRMSCELVPLRSFDADRPELAGSRLPGNHSVQMMLVAPDNRRRSLQR